MDVAIEVDCRPKRCVWICYVLWRTPVAVASGSRRYIGEENEMNSVFHFGLLCTNYLHVVLL